MKVVKTQVVYWGVTLCMLCFCSCSLHQPVAEDRKTEQVIQEEHYAPVQDTGYLSHVVQWQGENLTTISLWYTGSVKNWIRILEFNSEIDPKQIGIGDIVQIPDDLIITREPMPKEFSGTSKRMKKKSAPESLTELPTNRDEHQLFGPIDAQTDERGHHEEGGLSLSLDTID